MHSLEIGQKGLPGKALLRPDTVTIERAALTQLTREHAELQFENQRLRGELDALQSVAVLFEAIPIGVLRLGDRGEAPLLNPVARQILRLPQGEPEDAALVERRLGFSPRGRCCGDEGPCREERTYGSARFDVDCRCITTGGRHRGTLVILRDISREHELDQLKTEFAQVVSHELRTPLTAIKNAVDLLQADGGDPQVQGRLVDVAQRNTARMADLVQDLLDLSRLEAGRSELTMIEGNLGRIASTAAACLAQQAEARGVTVELRLPEALPPFHFDAAALERVLTNLLSNAIKYTRPRTRVRVAIEHQRGQSPEGAQSGPRAQLLQSFAAGTVCIRVSDQGIGIPIADQPRIFDKFVRLKRQLHRGVNGSGLGLSIADKLVRAHGGELWVDSVPGEGATFSARIPIFDQQGALAITLADRITEAKRDRRSLGIGVLRLDAEHAEASDQEDLAQVARRALFRASDDALFFPRSGELVLLLEGCHPELLHQVTDRVAKELRRQRLEADPRGQVKIAQAHAYSPHDASFDEAAVCLAEAREQAAAGVFEQRPRRVLIVDDEPLILTAMGRLLKAHGYEPICCSDGRAALELIDEDPPDLVLLDIMMPGHDGYHVCLEIRSRPLLRDLPIFFASGLDEGDSRTRMLSAGGNEFLRKPLDTEDLVRLLRLYLG